VPAATTLARPHRSGNPAEGPPPTAVPATAAHNNNDVRETRVGRTDRSQAALVARGAAPLSCSATAATRRQRAVESAPEHAHRTGAPGPQVRKIAADTNESNPNPAARSRDVSVPAFAPAVDTDQLPVEARPL
jgi:hypothetical protein